MDTRTAPQEIVIFTAIEIRLLDSGLDTDQSQALAERISEIDGVDVMSYGPESIKFFADPVELDRLRSAVKQVADDFVTSLPAQNRIDVGFAETI